MKIITQGFEIVEVRPKKKFYYLGETWAIVSYPSEIVGGGELYYSNKIVHFDTGVIIPLNAINKETLNSFIIRAESVLNGIFKSLGAKKFKAEINKHTKIN
jgi:hypothetical protein